MEMTQDNAILGLCGWGAIIDLVEGEDGGGGLLEGE